MKNRSKQLIERHGVQTEIYICVEELNELSAVLMKINRYISEKVALVSLHDKVLSELADVTIGLEHVKNAFSISEEELKEEVKRKLDRQDERDKINGK